MLEAPIENKFFGMCIPLGYHFCVLPDILKTQKKTKFYTFLIYAPAIFFHTCEIFKLYQLTFGEFFIADECIRNFVITYLRFMILVKCFFLRGKLSGKIFTKILQYEEFIYKTEDKEVISIYESNLSRLKRINHFFLASNVVMVFFYGLAPSLRDSYYIQRGNETIEIPQYPLSIWTPVEHIYWCAYVWSTFAGVYIVILFVATEMILYSFIYSGICQIQILKQYIANFYRHAEILAQTYRYAEAESLRVLQKKYIKTHQEIIEYVQELNSGLKFIVFFDNLPGPIQLAGMVYQLLSNLSIVQGILVGEFIGLLTARVFFYCFSAHTLAEESEDIARAWYNIDWIELPPDVRKNILICISRSQKPLYIMFGNFGNMSLTTFLAIMKGTYSYIMLLATMLKL